MEEKVARGRYFCMLYQYSDMLTQQKILYANDPDSIYMAVEGPRNANGDDPLRPTTTINGWTVTLISKNCKHPERAIAFLDYLMSRARAASHLSGRRGCDLRYKGRKAGTPR